MERYVLKLGFFCPSLPPFETAGPWFVNSFYSLRSLGECWFIIHSYKCELRGELFAIEYYLSTKYNVVSISFSPGHKVPLKSDS